MQDVATREGFREEVTPWIPEIHGVNDPEDSWSSNSYRYDSAKEAEDYLRYDLGMRWFGFDWSRVRNVVTGEVVNVHSK